MNADDLARFAEKSQRAAALTERANDLAAALAAWPEAISIRLAIKPGYTRGITVEQDNRHLQREEWADVDVTDRLARALFDCLAQMAAETHRDLVALFSPDPILTPAPFDADPFHVAPDRIDQRPTSTEVSP